MTEEKVGKTQHERDTSHHRAEEIKTCPNPVCGKGKVVLKGPLWLFFQVKCEKCGLIGPRHKDSLTAIELWNGLPRHGEPYGERCLLWHDWSKWADHKEEKRQIITKGDAPNISKGSYLIQIRSCKRCGKKQFERERVFDVDLDTKDKK